MILLDWPQKEQSHRRIFDRLVDEVIWDAKVPVAAVRLNQSVEALERLIFVVAAHTTGVKLDERAVKLVGHIGKALELPLTVMASGHYLEDLKRKFAPEKAENRHEVRALHGDYAAQVAEYAGEHDLVIMTTMGSQKRFGQAQRESPPACWRSWILRFW